MDLGTMISLGSFIMTIIILGFNFFSHQKITGNDLHHLAIDVNKISDKVDDLAKKVEKSTIRITILEEQVKDL